MDFSGFVFHMCSDESKVKWKKIGFKVKDDQVQIMKDYYLKMMESNGN